MTCDLVMECSECGAEACLSYSITVEDGRPWEAPNPEAFIEDYEFLCAKCTKAIRKGVKS